LENDTIEVFTYGIEPVSIDVMKNVKGLNFEKVFNSSQIFMDDDLPVRFIGYQQLLEAKKASGRYKDLDDLEKLSF
jgi:molybdenum cofactor biosynthesis enzyme MoaA